MHKSLLWAITIAVVILPPTCLIVKPELYTPLVAAILSSGLFLLSRLIGQEQAEQRGLRTANERWLPQSESAMHRLLTVLSSLKRFRSELSQICSTAAKDLPEIDLEKNKAIKMLISTHCRLGSAQLIDIANHVQDALSDWSRFVRANCQGEDCGRIFMEIKKKQDTLEVQQSGECQSHPCLLQQSRDAETQEIGNGEHADREGPGSSLP